MATTITSREFNHDTGRAKRAANDGPVFITDRGRPAHVLLSIEDYRRLAPEPPKPFMSVLESIADYRPEADFDFDVPRLRGPLMKPVDFD